MKAWPTVEKENVRSISCDCAAPPKIVDRYPGEQDRDADPRVRGITIDGVGDQRHAGGAEKKRSEWVPWNARFAWRGSFLLQHKHTACGEPEEDPVHCHHVIQDLLVAPGEQDDDRPYTLQQDREDRHARRWMHPGHAAKK